MNRCHGLVSVFRMEVDKCDRLWVLDTGAINLANKVDQICPVKLDVFDLKTDTHIKRFIIPKNQTLKDSLFTNIVVEILNDNCEDAYAYMSDVFQYGLVVYSYKKVPNYTNKFMYRVHLCLFKNELFFKQSYVPIILYSHIGRVRFNKNNVTVKICRRLKRQWPRE